MHRYDFADIVTFCVRKCLLNFYGRSLPCQYFTVAGKDSELRERGGGGRGGGIDKG